MIGKIDFTLARSTGSNCMERHCDFLIKLPDGMELSLCVEWDERLHVYGSKDEVVVPEVAYAGRGYFRDNGKYKSTFLLPVDPSNITANLYEQLKRYKSIYAIDTSYKPMGALCVSCAVHVGLEYLGGQKWNAFYTRLPAVISKPSNENPEVVAWRRLVERLPLYKIGGLVGMVVDSELAKIPLYNARSLPLTEGYNLPDSVELIYASSERDVCSPLNKAIDLCDKDAASILGLIESRDGLIEVCKNAINLSKTDAIYLQPSR